MVGPLFRRSRSATASLERQVCRGYPWLAIDAWAAGRIILRDGGPHDEVAAPQDESAASHCSGMSRLRTCRMPLFHLTSGTTTGMLSMVRASFLVSRTCVFLSAVTCSFFSNFGTSARLTRLSA